MPEPCKTADMMRRELENGATDRMSDAERKRWLRRFAEAVAQCAVSRERGLDEASPKLASKVKVIAEKNKLLRLMLRDSATSFAERLKAADASIAATRRLLGSPAGKKK